MDPNQLTPVPGNPNIRYDRFGQPYVQDVSGHWVQLYAPTMVTSQSVPTATHGFPAVSQNETAPTRPHNNMEDGPNQPLSEALVIVASTRAPTAGPSTAVIDPALLPLPEVSDDDLSDPVTIVKSRGHAAAKKVAGSCQKGKGKQRAVLTESRDKGKEKATARKRRHASDDEEVEVVAKRGRPKGAGNYTADEVDALLDFVEEELPLGQRGWQSIHRGFTRWAHRNDAAERTLKSLETKFKQLVKTTKPTGDAYCPPDIKRAHKIDGRINKRAATRDLNDSDFDDAVQLTGGSEDDDDNADDIPEAPKKSRKAASAGNRDIQNAIIRRPDPAVQRRSRSNNVDLIGKLANAFDPSVQQARDEERAQRSFQASQMFTLSQQLRDANLTIESLRSQLSTLQTQVHEAQRARDRAELQLQLIEEGSRQSRPFRRSRHNGYVKRSKSTKRSVQRVRGKMHCEERYPEGGIHTYWVTDPSSTSGESDKENEDPNFFRRRCDIDYRDQPSSSSSSGHHFGIELQALTTSQPNAATATAGKDQDGEEGDDDDIYVKDADGPKDE
ncbi:unnamed protein product [Cyclocybe aegerita]|uniref:DUF6818 domain-containing protein n=1 Tax=Cyclocybe aegerita TaxID=1973307 RepID=A0A8S0W333_CYCAE|nr:unnamed protein product [Cyclocybe aegerita]